MVKKNKYIQQAKGTMALGVGSMAGLGAMGAMRGIPGMPSQAGNLMGVAGAGLTLANVGNLAQVGMNVMPKGTTVSKKVYKVKRKR